MFAVRFYLCEHFKSLLSAEGSILKFVSFSFLLLLLLWEGRNVKIACSMNLTGTEQDTGAYSIGRNERKGPFVF